MFGNVVNYLNAEVIVFFCGCNTLFFFLMFEVFIVLNQNKIIAKYFLNKVKKKKQNIFNAESHRYFGELSLGQLAQAEARQSETMSGVNRNLRPLILLLRPRLIEVLTPS